ncbi:tetratricopeptide repeat protein [Kaarinaea lacus]
MKLRTFFYPIYCVVGIGFFSTGFASDANQDSDKIKQILFNAKFAEMQIEPGDANHPRDVESVQYKIGFKDGYQKAVEDLKKSFASGVVTPVTASQTATDQQSKPPKAKANELVHKSFEQLVKDGDWDAAIKSASAAIDLNPADPTAYINRSWAHAEKGMLDDAISDANKAVELSPRNAMAYNNRGYAYELAGSLSKAKKDYKTACDLKYQPACKTISVFERAKTGDTQKEVKELLNRSFQKFKEKDWRAVEEISTRAISLDPGNAMAYVNRSGARAEMGMLTSALGDCNRAIQLNPGLGLAHNNCGYTYELLGQPKQAEVAYLQACNLGVKKSCRDYFRLNNAVAR